jgi:hypothetical protein
VLHDPDVHDSARPADAKISHRQRRARARGRSPRRCLQGQERHAHGRVSRLGFKDQEISHHQDFPRDQIEVELRPRTRKVTFTVSPAPAVIKVDGRRCRRGRIERFAGVGSFTVDAQDKWIAHKVVAERPNYKPRKSAFSWTDNKQTYPIKLEPLTKDTRIASEPTGAVVYINDKKVGPTPVTIEDHPFPSILRRTTSCRRR